jgi:peptide/nickel transport system substrate-binding protein
MDEDRDRGQRGKSGAGWPLSRRDVLKTGASVAGAALASGIVPSESRAAEPSKTLVVASPQTPQSLDSEFDISLGSIDATGVLQENLVEYAKIPDPKLPSIMREDIAHYADKQGGANLVGKLAEKWEMDPGDTWARFKMREGVKSNWGNELTAEDVRWSWNRKLEMGGVGLFYTSTLGITSPDQFKVEDKYTFSFNLGHPNPILVRIMPNLFCHVFDSTKCKEVGGTADPWAKKFLESNTASFGPYTLERLERGQQAVFKARPDYYRGKPYFDTVIYKEVPTSAARVSLLRGGAVDVAQFLQPLEVMGLKNQPGVSVDTIDATSMLWIELNMKIPPFDKVEVRRAMNFAFPQEQAIKTIFQSLGAPLQGCMPWFYPSYTHDYWQYGFDIEQAKSLLKEAGLPNGFKTQLSYNAGDPVHESIAILYQSTLRQIGVELELHKIPAGTFYNAVSERKQPMIFYQDNPWTPDPGYAMILYFASQSFVDYSNYKDDEVDKLLHDIARSADEPARVEMSHRAQKIVMDQAPWVFISYPNYHWARKSDIKGFTYYTSNNIRFQDLSRG